MKLSNCFFDRPAEEVHEAVIEALDEMAENLKEMKPGAQKKEDEDIEEDKEEPRH